MVILTLYRDRSGDVTAISKWVRIFLAPSKLEARILSQLWSFSFASKLHTSPHVLRTYGRYLTNTVVVGGRLILPLIRQYG